MSDIRVPVYNLIAITSAVKYFAIAKYFNMQMYKKKNSVFIKAYEAKRVAEKIPPCENGAEFIRTHSRLLFIFYFIYWRMFTTNVRF